MSKIQFNIDDIFGLITKDKTINYTNKNNVKAKHLFTKEITSFPVITLCVGSLNPSITSKKAIVLMLLRDLLNRAEGNNIVIRQQLEWHEEPTHVDLSMRVAFIPSEYVWVNPDISCEKLEAMDMRMLENK